MFKNVIIKGKFYSSEFRQHFKTDDLFARFKKLQK
jgi:hypothetical protein